VVGQKDSAISLETAQVLAAMFSLHGRWKRFFPLRAQIPHESKRIAAWAARFVGSFDKWSCIP
jgi:hypothetical protein